MLEILRDFGPSIPDRRSNPTKELRPKLGKPSGAALAWPAQFNLLEKLSAASGSREPLLPMGGIAQLVER